MRSSSRRARSRSAASARHCVGRAGRSRPAPAGSAGRAHSRAAHLGGDAPRPRRRPASCARVALVVERQQHQQRLRHQQQRDQRRPQQQRGASAARPARARRAAVQRAAVMVRRRSIARAAAQSRYAVSRMCGAGGARQQGVRPPAQSAPRAPPPDHREHRHGQPEEKRAELRHAALEYHEFPTPGQDGRSRPTKQLINQRDLALAYSPGVAAACEEIVADPAQRLPLHRARQPGGGDHQRHRGARPGRHRPAGRQAGDGRQGRAVQEVRRHRRVRHRDQRERTSTSWSTSSPRWSRPSAASTSRTSRRRTASTSSASCASA